MRLYEITDRNKEAIRKRLFNWFGIHGTELVDDDGNITINGSCQSLNRPGKRPDINPKTGQMVMTVPLNFKEVTGNFDFANPSINHFTFPTKVGKHFHVSGIPLITLKGCPDEVGDFGWSKTDIISLAGAPQIVHRNFDCTDNKLLRTLNGCPENVPAEFSCYGNSLKSLVGGPKTVGGNYNCGKNPLISLEGLPESVGKRMHIPYTAELPLLRLMSVQNVTEIKFLPDHPPREYIKTVESIVNKYLRTGQGGALACAAELNKAGFRGNARR